MFVLILIAILMSSPMTGSAFVKQTTTDIFEQKLVKDRWIDKSLQERQKRLKTTKDPLALAGLAKALGQWGSCIQAASKLNANHVVKDWAILVELRCISKWLDEDSIKSNRAALSTIVARLDRLDKLKGLWINSTLGSKIEPLITQNRLSVAEFLDQQNRWKDLKGEVQKLLKNEYALSKAARARAYFFAGQVLLAERDWVAAYWQYDRSRSLDPNAGVDAKIKNVLPLLPNSVRNQLQINAQSTPTPSLGELSPSPEEAELYSQGLNYLARGDFGNGVEALARLLKQFPQGVRAKAASDKISELLSAEMEKSRGAQGDTNGKRKILSELLQLDADRQSEWAKTLFDSQGFAEAGPLFLKAAEESEDSPRAAKFFYMAGRSYQLSSQFSEAKKIFKKVLTKYPASPESADAAIHWALINYNENDPAEAITHLEMARSRKLTSQQDLISLFWLFQSYKQKKAEPELLKTGQELMARFPLTY
ncbi:MAG: tetratricopeptide repeat protein, partial [Oligoflexia bacterium]|nr:tetratricopeptide repeat protein [Oligoflexia bacterium]